MNRWKRRLGYMALAGFVVFLAFAAAGCGGGDDDEGASENIAGLGSDLDEIKQAEEARSTRPGRLPSHGEFATNRVHGQDEDGLTRNMISLIGTGQYDGVSASERGVRLMEGDVAPVNNGDPELRRRRGSRTSHNSGTEPYGCRTVAGRTCCVAD
jgi:hypothetical protein